MTLCEDEYYAKLYRRFMRKSDYHIPTALKMLEESHTGSNTRQAIRHQMDTPSWKLTQELKLYNIFKSILKNQKVPA
jgi:hypothetical protein